MQVKDIAYMVECGTVGEDELNVSHELLDSLVVVEVCFVQTTSHSPEVHWSDNDLVVVWNLVQYVSQK